MLDVFLKIPLQSVLGSTLLFCAREGKALVSHEPICLYLTDLKTGIIREKTHERAGKNVTNKILVFPSGKANSVVQMDGLYQLVTNNLAPRAVIVQDVETVLAVTAFIEKVSLVDKLEKDPLSIIRRGDCGKSQRRQRHSHNHNAKSSHAFLALLSVRSTYRLVI
jgi:predicted aconitase with swiveling domain